MIAEGFTVRDALDRVAAAAREGLADGPLDRDAFHQAMRERLPDGLLPWCRGCQSHHVRPGFWRALGPLEVTEMPEKATWGLADPPDMPLEEARAELVRRFLRVYGPATHSQLASLAQTAASHAKRLFAAIADELEPAAVEGRKGFVLAEDAARLESPPAAQGVRLLGGHDPYVAQPDREALVPDAAVRKRLFPSVGRPGAVLADGVLAGLWRGYKKGDVLEVGVEWLGDPVDVAEEAEAIARLRGCAAARVALELLHDRPDRDLPIVAVVHVGPRAVAALGPVEVLPVLDASSGGFLTILRARLHEMRLLPLTRKTLKVAPNRDAFPHFFEPLVELGIFGGC